MSVQVIWSQLHAIIVFSVYTFVAVLHFVL